jgi:hypothetical protein
MRDVADGVNTACASVGVVGRGDQLGSYTASKKLAGR